MCMYVLLCVHQKRFCAILLGLLSSKVFSLFILPLDQWVPHLFWMSNGSLQRISYFIISSHFIIVVWCLSTSHCYVASCEMVVAAATLIQILVKVIWILLSDMNCLVRHKIKCGQTKLAQNSKETVHKVFCQWASLKTAALTSVTLMFDGLWERWNDAQAMAGVSKFCGTEKHSQALDLNPLSW